MKSAIGHITEAKCVCRVEELRPQDKMSPERVANTFAADLLMPRYLFAPAARAYPKLNFKCEFRRNPATDSDLMPAAVPI